MKKDLNKGMSVKIRFREIKDGKTIYLEWNANGRTEKKYLGYHLINGTSPQIKAENQNLLNMAEKARAEIILALSDGLSSIKTKHGTKITLIDYLKEYKQNGEKVWQSKSRSDTMESIILHIQNFCGERVLLREVNKSFCERFVSYLSTAKKFVRDSDDIHSLKSVQSDVEIAQSTKHVYYSAFISSLNEAVCKGYINDNPAKKIGREYKKIISKPTGSTREYLSIDEIKTLENTPCGNDEVKTAFLFSCFCGLRISDVRSLCANDIKADGDKTYIVKRMKKTQKDIIIPLSQNAMKYLPSTEGKSPVEPLFNLRDESSVNRSLRSWGKRAKIEKKMCFHVARHTFATSLLTLGADLYTTSKLLGHADLKTTQIYADIVDKKKIETIDLLDKI